MGAARSCSLLQLEVNPNYFSESVLSNSSVYLRRRVLQSSKVFTKSDHSAIFPPKSAFD